MQVSSAVIVGMKMFFDDVLRVRADGEQLVSHDRKRRELTAPVSSNKYIHRCLKSLTEL